MGNALKYFNLGVILAGVIAIVQHPWFCNMPGISLIIIIHRIMHIDGWELKIVCLTGSWGGVLAYACEVEIIPRLEGCRMSWVVKPPISGNSCTACWFLEVQGK